jgi:hypothetical protein
MDAQVLGHRRHLMAFTAGTIPHKMQCNITLSPPYRRLDLGNHIDKVSAIPEKYGRCSSITIPLRPHSLL